ncbi:MAG TPA: ABC transporter ATP-binding protein [Candidatus Limnocylindria bacterium]|nr:ABC transporter ATP-binding protein [Candidatus Limnocylindria bacterium]
MSAPVPPLLALQGVSKRFAADRPPAVDGLSFTLERGHILALLGPSGCGKTTTLRLIAGFEALDEGRVSIAGAVIASAGGIGVPPEARGVGVVFQDYALFPHLSVEDNVGFGLRRRPRGERAIRVRQILDLVGLTDFARRFPHELSGGQQQRVAAARALAPAPALLLLDEPFSNLDADLRAQMRDEVEKILRATNTTAIFVTHDQEEAFTIADEVGVLNRGRLEQLGPPETIYHHPATPFVAEFVGAADFLPGLVTAGGIVTEIGTFDNVEGREPGEKVKVMIRPDDVTFVPDTAGDAVIVRRDFRGPETLYSLALPSGHRVHSSQPSSAAFVKGTRVRPEAHVLHVVTFPAF